VPKDFKALKVLAFRARKVYKELKALKVLAFKELRV
jgi:hypothetical protein